jgi:multiple antibiotic resistance protein
VDTKSFITMIVSLFAITAPIAVLPIFVAATEGQTGGQQRRTALVATATYVGAGLIALFVGNAVLGFFGVSVAALRVAGMAVIAVIGWKMLNAPTPSSDDAVAGEGASGGGISGTADKPHKRSHHLHTASNTKVAVGDPSKRSRVPSPLSVGIMPLGFPIYAGPGALSVIIAWGSGAKEVYIAAIVAILANGCIIVALDFLATPITRLIGAEGLLVTEKVFGLIVVAIAVTGMSSALLVLFPGLAGGVH